MSNDEVIDIYKLHLLWLFDVEGGIQAEFINQTIKGIDFSDKYFCGAIFENCTFIDCDFFSAFMNGSNFRGAKFVGCNFYESDFTG
ncbi:MAG: pentapeptide repeat-containing protein, partial [Lachnospiraceae bacterium]